MESRLLQAGSVASPRACCLVSSARAGAGAGAGYRQGQQGFRVAVQRFMRGVDVRQVGSVCGRQERRVSRSRSFAVVCQRPDQENAGRDSAATRTGKRLQDCLQSCKNSMLEANDKMETKIARRLGIDEPLSHYIEKKGKEIRSEMVGTAGSAYSSVVAISSRPVVKRSIFGFLLFYAISIVWAARILMFDKKSEEAREQFGRELRLQKLREGAESAPAAIAPVDYTQINVNGRKVSSANDADFRDKVRRIQEMARAVRIAEQEVFSPSESAFVTISGKRPNKESEQQQSSIPTYNEDLQKERKQMSVKSRDQLVGLDNNVVTKATQVEKSVDEVVGKRAHEPEPRVIAESQRPVAIQAPIRAVIGAEDNKNVKALENFQSKVGNEDMNLASGSDSELPLNGDVVSSLNSDTSALNRSAIVSTDCTSAPSTSGEVKLSSNGSAISSTDVTPAPSTSGEVKLPSNGSAKAFTDGTPAPSTLGEVKLPSNGNATLNVNGVARPVPPVSGQPQKFKSMRVITSPEEARARIAARKAKDGSTSAKGSSANSTRPKFPRIKSPIVESDEDDLGTDPKSGKAGAQTGSKGKDMESVGASEGNKVNSKSSPSQKERQKPKSDEQQEEASWMRDEVLRRIVLKVRDNEEAGRESFHGLDSEEEQQFFKGLERKFEREGEAVKTWIQDRVENLDYGFGGVGVDDPPESFMPKWKDPENPSAKRFEKFQQDRQQIIQQQMGISKPSQTDGASGASSSSSSSLSPASKTSSKDTSTTDDSRERLQSNGKASGSKTVVTSTGKQAKPVAREWQHTKKWAQELQRKYDLETNSEQRSMMEEVGQDLDRWITEDEIEEASRLLSKGLAGEQEYVKMHYEKTREKMKKQHEMFGSQGMLNKYGEYKETKKEVELWWLDLPYVLCIGLTNSEPGDGENNQGFYTLDMTPDFAGLEVQGRKGRTYNHTIAFQDPKDASNFCGLLLSERYVADVIPIAPKDLYQDVKEQGFKVTVIKKGQLGLKPGQALDDVEQRLIEIGSSVYWEELERARSIDIDAVLDEGLGYGRPSR